MLSCSVLFAQNVTNLWQGRPLYQGMPLTTVPSANVSLGAVGFDNDWRTNFAYNATPAGPLTVSVGSAGANRLLIVSALVCEPLNALTNVPVYAGTPMTFLCVTNIHSATEGSNWVFYLVNPAVGNNNLVFGISNVAKRVFFRALFFTNANQSSSISNYTINYKVATRSFYGNTNSAASATNDIVVDFYSGYGVIPTFKASSIQTMLTNGLLASELMLTVSSYAPAAASTTTMWWTNTLAWDCYTHITATIKAR